MLDTILRCLLAYVTFLRPVIYGAQLCKKENPDPREVTNITLALVFSWLLELADMMFLSSFIAARGVYTASRIVLCLYFCHPSFLGALQVYERLLARLMDVYGPTMDSLLVQHMDAIGESGMVHYSTTVCMSLFRAAMELVDIGRRLMESTAETKVAAAPLPRRLSQGPPSRSSGVEDDEAIATARPEEQYVTPSVVAKVRRTASTQGYMNPSSQLPSRGSTSPLPQPTVLRNEAGGFQECRRHGGAAVPSSPPPLMPAPHLQWGRENARGGEAGGRHPQELAPSFDEDDYSGDSSTTGSSTPRAAVRRRPQGQVDYYYDNSVVDF